jgi:uncharacterized protein YraI
MAKRHHALILAVLMALIGTLTSVVLGQSGLGTGWTVQYFNSTTLSGGPIYTETLPNGINFNWGTGSPNPLVPVDNFSARYTSVQLFTQGTYEFVAASDDGVRVFIDNVLVLDRFVGRVLTTDRFQQTLTAGSHSLTVEYLELIDQAALQFQWFLISAGVATVPPGGGFATPFGTPAPTAVYTGPAATVAGVRGLALRTGPYLGATYITALVGGQGYPVLARNRDEGVYNWYLLQVGDRRGWASGRYLQLNVDPNSLPIQGSVFDEFANPPDPGIATAVTRAVMNLRARPSNRSPQIGSLPWGAAAALLGRTVQGGTDRWYQVSYNGQVGWIAAPWVTVRGERFNVPVR